jgi:hypothetical protein
MPEDREVAQDGVARLQQVVDSDGCQEPEGDPERSHALALRGHQPQHDGLLGM